MIKQLHRHTDGKPIYVNMDQVMTVEHSAHGTMITMRDALIYVKEKPEEVVAS